MRVSLWSVLVFGMLAMLLCPGVSAEDEEVAVPLDKLPKAIVDSVKKMFPDAELKSATKEVVQEADDDDDDDDEKAADKEDKDDDEKNESKVVYEVTLSEKGQRIDVTVEEDGEIEEVERSIDLNDLPKIVTDALAKRFPKSTLKSAEAIYEVEDGELELEGYEVILETADKEEVEVNVEVEIEISVD